MNHQAHSAKLLVESLNRGSNPNADLPNPHAPPAYTVHPSVEASDIQPAPSLLSEDSSTSEEFSAISFTIRTPLHIVGNGNLLALSPPVLAAGIAEKIMREIKSASMTDGIPMIDEHGRPRPIDVIVEAGVEVRGNGNVVGEREVLGVVARNMRRSPTSLAVGAVSESVDNGSTEPVVVQKGKRAASEPLRESSLKRERRA